jgi:hypothetical protein
MRPKTFVADPRSGLDKFVDELYNLPLHTSAAQIEMESAPGSTSSGVATTSPGLDLFQSRDPHSRSQLGSCKPATDLQEANISGSLSMLEKDLDLLLQDGKPEATVCRGAPGCSGPGDLVITSLLKGRIVHWRGMMLSDLLEAEGRLVAHLEPLPFQEGRPLATAAEGSTELVDESSHDLTSRQVLMAEEGETMRTFPSSTLKRSPKMRSRPTLVMRTTPIVRRGGPGTGPAQSGGAGPTSVGDLCIASLTLSSPL